MYPGSGERNPCCMECETPCEMECSRALSERTEKTFGSVVTLQQYKEDASEMNRQETLIDKAEREAEERELSDLEFARKELEIAQSILWEMTGRGAAVDEKCIRSQKMLVAAYKSLIHSFERGIQLSQIK